MDHFMLSNYYLLRKFNAGFLKSPIKRTFYGTIFLKQKLKFVILIKWEYNYQ